MKTRSCALLIGSLLATCAVRQSIAAAVSSSSRSALNEIEGVWQSDTVGGVSARSTCASSPTGSAVICEQDVIGPRGVGRALNLYTVRDTPPGYVFYNLSHVGDSMRPVPLVIANHIWSYGGEARGDDGRFHRTVNDFSAKTSYTWWQESSEDGRHWVREAHGRSVRVR